MKKYLLFVSFLFVLTLLGACDNDSPDSGNIILPVNVADESIVDFLNAELPSNNHYYYKSFFIDRQTNYFHIINSQQELADIYVGDKELPEVDFDQYTLIIGQQIMPYTGFYITKTELVEGGDGIVFNLYVRHDGYDDENRNAALQFLYYWEFYPKLSQDNISINVIKEFPNRGKNGGII